MPTNKNDYALVTGATSGIGYEIAKLLAQNGHNLIIVSRQEEELRKKSEEFSKYGIKVSTIKKDLFGENSAREIYDEVRQKGLTVSILVNDAGQGVYGPFIETEIEKQMKVIHLNIVALTGLTYYFLKEMVARNEGKILQLGSIVSQVPAPLQSVYGGTKAYVLSFTEALIREVENTNVTLTVLQPGATDTDFFNKAGAQNSKIVKGKLDDPARVAKDGYEAMMAGKDKVVSGIKNKFQAALSNITPETKLADQMYEQSKEDDSK